MKYKVGVTLQVELVIDSTNEQDAILAAMNLTEDAAKGMRVRRHWWEYVKEADDETAISGPAEF